MPVRRPPLPLDLPRPLRWHLLLGALIQGSLALGCWLGAMELGDAATILLVVLLIQGICAGQDVQELGDAFWEPLEPNTQEK